MLLTVPLRGSREDAVSPLSPTEWARLIDWLHSGGIKQDELLSAGASIIAEMHDTKITLDRLERLLDRGPALGFALEKWQSAGIFVLESASEHYPSQLLERLGPLAPPVLFGIGSRQLLQSPSVAIVGSRNADENDLEAASRIAGDVVRQGFAVVSGAARGIDQAAMNGALARDGSVVGIPSFGLLSDATNRHYRQGFLDMELVHVSPFNPEARFDVGNAMARNKLIYSMSTAAVVVVTEANRGGTWAGATECLKRGWVPVWVHGNGEPVPGNEALVGLGAKWLPQEFDLHDLAAKEPEPSRLNEERASYFEVGVESYTQFLEKLQSLLADGPRTKDEIGSSLTVANGLLKSWLVQATDEGYIKRQARPERYRLLPQKLL